LRFSIIGALLAAPPAKGARRPALLQLAAREWRHPSTGAPIRFSVSTIERWFYKSRSEQQDPVGVLRRKRRQDAGEQASMNPTAATGAAGPVCRTQKLECPASS